MLDNGPASYYRLREADQRQRASDSVNPAVQKLYLEMAAHYAEVARQAEDAAMAAQAHRRLAL